MTIFDSKHSLVGTMSLVLLLAILVLPGMGAEEPRYGGTLKWGISEIAPSLDPHHGMGYGQLPQYMAFNKLVHHDPETLKLKPELATSWEIPDNRTYIFHLREGVKFHDGSEFDANVAKWNFERLLSDYSQARDRVKMIEEMEVLDDYTLKVKLEKPFAPFLDNLATMSIRFVSKKAVEENGNEYIQKHPVGTGPFKFVEWDKQGGTLTFERFEGYWGDEPYLDKWVFYEIPEPQTRVAALKRGDIDVLHSTPDADVANLRKSGQFKLISHMASSNSIDYLTFNCAKAPFDDPKVRKAVALALDEEQIVEFLPNTEPIYGPLPPESWGSPPDAEDPPYDPQRAKELLAEAGYPDGFEVKLKIWSNDPSRSNLAQITQSMLKEVGVDVKIEVLESSTLIEQMRVGGAEANWKFASLHWGGGGALDPNGNLQILFHSDNGQFNWISNYSNEKVDELLDQALEITDREERQKLYWEAFRIITSDHPMIWFGRFAGYKAVAEYVHGMAPLTPTGYFTADTTNVWIEER